jgi:hypothetical protein
MEPLCARVPSAQFDIENGFIEHPAAASRISHR